MKFYPLVLFCVLFTTSTSFSLPDAIPENTNDSLILDSQNRNCNCENGNCVTDKLGNYKCVCKPGFAIQDEFTCKPCDCGSLGKCIFVLKVTEGDKYQYQKKCVCDVGRAEKDGVCVDCFCGENSACDYDYGERRCYCIEGYSEKDGKCTRCDCGFYGQCEYKDGNKKCECDEGYLELNGMCEECDCGNHGTCSFENGQKTCKCQAGFSVNNGKCESCDCGPNSENCVFIDGVKQCKCKDRYADRYGTCEECYCGDYTRNCNFKDNQKTCNCLDDYVQKGETCELGCSAKNPCQNGGFCKGGFCFCQKGTRGEFCEVIDECSTLCPIQGDIKCSYDVASQKAYCRCLDSNLRYNPDMKQCKNTCDDSTPCQNGGSCDSTGSDAFCKCPPGTTGDLCDQIPECDTKRCSADSECIYDISQRKAVCRCHDTNLKFDTKTLQCKYPCDETRSCRNGGKCSSRGTDSFCDCLEGTTGDLCEKVPECDVKNCGPNARCAYDPTKLKAVCVCNDASLSFDPATVRCKKTCTLEESCKNGGICEQSDLAKFCKCPEGTVGDFCEKIPACDSVDCGTDAQCGYNVTQRKAACVCTDKDLFFDERNKKCKRTCVDDKSCKNQGKCVGTSYLKFCDCLNGTTGDFCEEISECGGIDCGPNAYCVLNPSTKKADCACKNPSLHYDSSVRKCRRSCSKDNECLNGGKCGYKGKKKFCNCLPGTQGDRCEIVNNCPDCKGEGAYCDFDVKKLNATCKCKDKKLEYDFVLRKCRWSCDEDTDCHNGGRCRYRGEHKFCHCLSGTQGPRCQIVDDCYSGRVICRGLSASCVFDVKKLKGFCKCKDKNDVYDIRNGRCRRIRNLRYLIEMEFEV